jgi:LCP family protein required for cell wall assembly
MEQTGDSPVIDSGSGRKPAPTAGGPSHPRKPRRRGAGRRRLGIGLVVLSVLLLIAVAAAAWWYFSFSAAVGAANGKIDASTRQALATPPPTTLVTAPQGTTVSSSGPATTEAPDAVMNMLVLGTDARPGAVEAPGSSDVIMVLHIDTRQDYMSILSVTRDLWVDIPGYGKDRINAAYYRGGPALTIATIKQTFGVDVTKYIGVGFEKFPGLIDSLGGVYVDVDRTYTDTPYWQINLSPGYQLLNGANALLFSRYRFDENADFGRMARQQRILAGLRDQARSWNKTLKLPGMVNTIMGSAATNLSADQMLKLAYWLVKLDGSRIKQIIIKGPGTMIDGKAVVVVDKAYLSQAITDFLTPPGSDSGQSASGAASRAADTGTTLLAAAGDEAVALALAVTPTTLVSPLATTSTEPPTTVTAGSAAILNATRWQAAQKTVPFRLMAPTALPADFAYAGKNPAGAGTYGIATGGGTKPAVRVLYRYKQSDLYLGISATTWTDAPLAGNGMVVQNNGVTYTVCGTLGNPDHVWWKEDGVLYWVSNTLMYTLTDQQLLNIAETMAPVSLSPAAH